MAILENKHKALGEANKNLEEMNERLMANHNQLIQSEKMASIGQLAAGVAHEINNPVGFVKSNLGTLTGYVKTFKTIFEEYKGLAGAMRNGDDKVQTVILENVEKISEKEDLPYILEDIDNLLTESIEGTERVRDIVQNLKSFARVDEAQIKEADINEGIEATLKIVWNELKYKCTVRKNLEPLPLIRCYPGQLNQVFMNILVNAAQAIPEKGDITIETEATGTHIVIRISDTGVGIKTENIPKLFDPFFTTKGVGKGTGLGLSISQGIIMKHNGSIDVESEVGKGTTFTIRLPIEGVVDDG
jgi:signal transduction histidine kinase